MKPDLKHYPVWLRDEILPTNPGKSILRDFRENEKALKEIYETCRESPLHRILFMLAVESIRNKFKMCAMEKKIEDLQEQIDDLNRRRP